MNELVGQVVVEGSRSVLLMAFLSESTQSRARLEQSLWPCLLWDQMESHPPVSFSTCCVSLFYFSVVFHLTTLTDFGLLLS